MSKKQSDADVLAKLQEMLGGRGVKDASFGPEGGDSGGSSGGSGGSGGSGPVPDSPSGGGEAPAQEQRAETVAASSEEADEWDDGLEGDLRDSKFVAFLQQCENELNASVV